MKAIIPFEIVWLSLLALRQGSSGERPHSDSRVRADISVPLGGRKSQPLEDLLSLLYFTRRPPSHDFPLEEGPERL